jgi:hypothetical protein
MDEENFNKDGWCEKHRLEDKPKKKKVAKPKKLCPPAEFSKDGWCESHR